MIWEILKNFGTSTGIAQLFQGDGWKQLIMILIAILLLYLAIFKEAEPYLLIPIGFGMLLVNLPGSDVYLKSNVDIKYTYETFANLIGVNAGTGREIFDTFGLQNVDVLELPLAKIVEYITKDLNKIL